MTYPTVLLAQPYLLTRSGVNHNRTTRFSERRKGCPSIAEKAKIRTVAQYGESHISLRYVRDERA